MVLLSSPCTGRKMTHVAPCPGQPCPRAASGSQGRAENDPELLTAAYCWTGKQPGSSGCLKGAAILLAPGNKHNFLIYQDNVVWD